MLKFFEIWDDKGEPDKKSGRDHEALSDRQAGDWSRGDGWGLMY